jgi:uncharacterized protein (DUF1501 family)
MLSRRSLFLGFGATLAAAALPGLGLSPVLAKAAGGSRKFLFVFAPGGWDPTRVFVPAYDIAGVAMEPDSDRWSIGGLTLVDHPQRPSVRTFFQAHAARSLVLNGMLVRSIAHEICTEIAMTGGSGGLGADWATRIAAPMADAFTLPSLVLGGPSFPGTQVFASARTGNNGQLQALVDGRALDFADQPQGGLSRPEEGIVDRYLLRRARARAAGAGGAADSRLATDVVRGLEKIADLKDLQYSMHFATSPAFGDQSDVAVEALALGVSRCVSLSFAGATQVLGWDTHANNDPQQSQLWEELFAGLGQLMSLLAAMPGESAPTLAEETVVVVLSEMGRTPAKNGLDGKDHWPYTSALVLGPGITGGRVVGAHDALYYGQPVDPKTGEIGGSNVLSAESLGATLLQLAGIDPAKELPGIAPITGVLT